MNGDRCGSELHALEIVLDELDELLRRQILPQYRQGDTISSQVFKQSDRMPSVYRDSIADRDEARSHWVLSLGKETVGTCVITVADVISANAQTVDDSRLPDRHAGHAYIDMRSLSSGERARAAQKLKRASIERGIEWDVQ